MRVTPRNCGTESCGRRKKKLPTNEVTTAEERHHDRERLTRTQTKTRSIDQCTARLLKVFDQRSCSNTFSRLEGLCPAFVPTALHPLHPTRNTTHRSSRSSPIRWFVMLTIFRRLSRSGATVFIAGLLYLLRFESVDNFGAYCGMPNHYVGDLLRTMAISGRSRVRTELLELAVIPAPAPEESFRRYPALEQADGVQSFEPLRLPEP